MAPKTASIDTTNVEIIASGDEQHAKYVIIELAKALARIAAREDDARENGS